MKRSTILFLISVLITASGCNYSNDYSKRKSEASESNPSSATPRGNAIGEPVGIPPKQQGQQGTLGRNSAIPTPQETSLDSAASSQAVAQAFERKIIRNAELRFETESPDDGQRKIATIAEKHGGFVVTSESKQNEGGVQPATIVNIVVRVPSAQFAATLEEILGTGGRVLHKKIAGQDVTEEYIDLEARIRTKRALEGQFLEIMKQSRKVSEALEVQTQLAEVRTEIERLEGRRRFLENQSALSTINIALQTPAPVVAATTRGFWHDIKSAFGDGVEVAVEVVLGVIRVVIALVPILLLIVLPCWILFKLLRRRITWPRRPASAQSENQ